MMLELTICHFGVFGQIHLYSQPAGAERLPLPLFTLVHSIQQLLSASGLCLAPVCSLPGSVLELVEEDSAGRQSVLPGVAELLASNSIYRKGQRRVRNGAYTALTMLYCQCNGPLPKSKKYKIGGDESTNAQIVNSYNVSHALKFCPGLLPVLHWIWRCTLEMVHRECVQFCYHQ